MLYNSYIFVLLFMPVTLIGYYTLNHFNKMVLSKIWILCMSLWFYGYFNIKYLPIIILSVILNYFFSYFLLKSQREVLRKIVFIVSLTFNIGILFYYKYLGFCVENINALFSQDFVLKNLALPLGISFFTFQQVSYVIDSYKRKVPVYNFLDYGLFVTFFPQLIAGPIVLHNEVVPQFSNKENKSFNFENFSKGITAFSYGLAKKVIIADSVGNAVNFAFADTDYFLNTTNAIIIMLAYTIQIYFDFSGYCDMSTGLGLMFNIKLPINFNSPYRALDDSDFWKRWHMTLTRLFTNYVYIPLGGNRKGKTRTDINTMIVFIISGIWHGANWTFILWGFIHGIAVVISKRLGNFLPKIPKFIRWIITFGFINFTWLLFRADSVHQFLFIVKSMLSFNFEGISSELVQSFCSSNIQFIEDVSGLGFIKYAIMFILIGFSIFASVFMKNTNERIDSFKVSKKNAVIAVALLIICILKFSSVSTFLYFNF